MSESRYPVDLEKQATSTQDPHKRTYTGSGTAEDPYVVDWDLNDPDDPYNWLKAKKWLITAQVHFLPISFSATF